MVVGRRRTADPEIYEAVKLFRRAALDGSSVLIAGEAVWTAAHFRDLRERFQDRVGSAKGKATPLGDQLADAGAGPVRLAAELLTLHLLVLSTSAMSPHNKRNLIRIVRNGIGEGDLPLPGPLDDALDRGFLNPGFPYLRHTTVQLTCLTNFGTALLELDPDRRSAVLDDPWEFKALVAALRPESAHTQRNVLLHLFHPDFFEAVVSRNHKKLIAETWRDLISDPTDDVDRQLRQIRAGLAGQYGPDFDFYDERVRPQWNPSSANWGKWMLWARRITRKAGIDQDERKSAFKIASIVRRARTQFDQGKPEWLITLKSTKTTNAPTPQDQAFSAFVEWAEKNPERATAALNEIWNEEVEVDVRIKGFSDHTDGAADLDASLSVAIRLLAGADPTIYPAYDRHAFDGALVLTGSQPVAEHRHPATAYAEFLTWLDTFIEQSTKHDMGLRDRLDAEILTRHVLDGSPPPQWPPRWSEQFAEWREKSAAARPVPLPAPTLQTLATRLSFPEPFLAEIEELWSDRRQVVLHGPPGTGKTYLARALARHVAGDGGMVEMVQFHPSYSYEDFVEGYRPGPDGRGFVRQDGPLKHIADHARENPHDTHVLVIDELNRGNVAKLFGELYFLLEYRNAPIRLQYSSAAFTMPENLRIIATMNTADRSIALVDAALRRRFYFVGMSPAEEPVKDLLSTWLKKNVPAMTWVAELVEEANRGLAAHDRLIGPSFFLREDLSEKWVERIWKHTVLPYLGEVLDDEDLGAFRLEALRARR